MSNRPTLHKYDGVLSITAYRCGCQAKHVFCPNTFKDRFKRKCRQVMAFINNDLPIIFHLIAHLSLP
ncbi:hypothetical protein D3C76_1245630 [compost metagenome]